MTIAIQNVKVATSTVDEWYGIEVTFDWATPPDSLPRWGSVEGLALLREVVPLVVASKAYDAYYAVPHQVSVDLTGSDSTQRSVWIPTFSRAEQFDQCEFHKAGGYLLATDR